VGAATELLTLNSQSATAGNAAEPALAFALQGGDNTLAGLATADIREIPGGQATVAVLGEVRSIRWFNNCLWLVGSQRIAGYAVGADGKSLELRVAVPILGATDVAALDAKTLAVVGTAGRAVYEYDSEGGPDDGRLLAAEREAGRLVGATSDGQRVFAGSEEGTWSYLINSRAELVSRPFSGGAAAPQSAAADGATAQISPDGTTITITPPVPSEPLEFTATGQEDVGPRAFDHREDKGALLRTVVAIDDKFWVGHDRGITILHADGGQPTVIPQQGDQPETVLPPEPVAQRLRIPGPVIHLFPLPVGKAAAYVSEFGGMGVVRYVDRSIEPAEPTEKD
jgi:hypothetical protein